MSRRAIVRKSTTLRGTAAQTAASADKGEYHHQYTRDVASVTLVKAVYARATDDNPAGGRGPSRLSNVGNAMATNEAIDERLSDPAAAGDNCRGVRSE